MTEDHCLCFPLHQCSDMVAFKVPPESLTGWRMKLFIDGLVLQVLNSWLLLFAFALARFSAAVFVFAVEAIGMDIVSSVTLDVPSYCLCNHLLDSEWLFFQNRLETAWKIHFFDFVIFLHFCHCTQSLLEADVNTFVSLS